MPFWQSHILPSWHEWYHSDKYTFDKIFKLLKIGLKCDLFSNLNKVWMVTRIPQCNQLLYWKTKLNSLSASVFSLLSHLPYTLHTCTNSHRYCEGYFISVQGMCLHCATFLSLRLPSLSPPANCLHMNVPHLTSLVYCPSFCIIRFHRLLSALCLQSVHAASLNDEFWIIAQLFFCSYYIFY